MKFRAGPIQGFPSPRSFVLLFDRRIRRFAGGTLLFAGAAGTSATAILWAAHPAAAAAVLATVQSAVTCATTTTTPCESGVNTSSGVGVLGESLRGAGVRGTSNTNNNGVKGTSDTGYGVLGKAAVTSAVAGFGAKYGAYGTSSGGNIGIWGSGGTGPNAIGVYGITSKGFGVVASSDSGKAVQATSNTGPGVLTVSGNATGIGIVGSTTTGTAVAARGAYVGLEGVSDGIPLRIVDSAGRVLFAVDSAGNVSQAGGLSSFARTAGGTTVTAFSPKATLPTVEDTGTAQLVGGSAVVLLDPTFAASIDAKSGYRVLLTPRGDTQGLFVAAMAADRFIVRESQGGRTTVSFDYRVLAPEFGAARQRMTAARAATPGVSLPAIPKLNPAQAPAPPRLP